MFTALVQEPEVTCVSFHFLGHEEFQNNSLYDVFIFYRAVK